QREANSVGSCRPRRVVLVMDLLKRHVRLWEERTWRNGFGLFELNLIIVIVQFALVRPKYLHASRHIELSLKCIEQFEVRGIEVCDDHKSTCGNALAGREIKVDATAQAPGGHWIRRLVQWQIG